MERETVDDPVYIDMISGRSFQIEIRLPALVISDPRRAAVILWSITYIFVVYIISQH